MLKTFLNGCLVFIGGILWRAGGSNEFPTWIRGIGVSTLFALIVLLNILNGSFPFFVFSNAIIYAGITWIITWGLLRISYGINSPIGKLFNFIQNQDFRDLAIRGTCATCWSGAYILSIIFRGNLLRILFCLIPILLMPLIRITKIDRFNPHIEEISMGIIYTLGLILIWTI